ncbi:MAG: VWA domain-containing protein [Candidatus Solibacter usitatus]|nr:VWA domain-containing protein [Candidatus Solibacter usitatus]
MPSTPWISGAPLALLGGAVLAVGLHARAQEVPAGEQAFRDTAEVSAVLVPVTVTDRKGRLVPGLDKNKFHLLVDGIEFPIRSFWRESGLPLSVAIVVDTSGSMGGRRLSRSREAIAELLRQRGGDDEVCLITFGAGEVKRRMRFGTDPALLPRVLESLRGFGTTALYDVLVASPQVMDGAKNIRRVVLFFTDGVDTASGMSSEDALRVLEALNDPIYVFGIEPPPASEGPADTYEELLKRFAASSGGRYLRVDNAAKLPEFSRALRRELTMRYIIGLEASGVGSAKWRKVEVRVDGDFQVQARHGYRGTLP